MTWSTPGMNCQVRVPAGILWRANTPQPWMGLFREHGVDEQHGGTFRAVDQVPAIIADATARTTAEETPAPRGLKRAFVRPATRSLAILLGVQCSSSAG